ncbi:MAG: hypothetical protein ACM3XO_03630 [Bacteroidota bacterium]
MNTLYQQTSVSVEALEASSFNYINWISSLPKIELSKQTNVTLISANAPVLYFNAAIQPDFHGNTEQRVEQTKEYFIGQGKSFNWLITPSSQPYNLAQQVLQQGGEFLEAVPYMVLRLDEMRRETTAPPDFHTELVLTPEMVHA